MALWTFMTLVGNGKRVYVEQVGASDFRGAVTEFVWRWDSGVWMFGCDFEMEELPVEWGSEVPTVWVIRTDNSPSSQGELF